MKQRWEQKKIKIVVLNKSIVAINANGQNILIEI